MTVGSLQKPEANDTIVTTPLSELDIKLENLAANAERWANVSIAERITFLESIMDKTAEVAERWVAAACEAKGIAMHSPESGQEWHSGPALTIRQARLLRDSLADIAEHGSPQLPGPVTVRQDGQTTVQVFPTDNYDKALWMGYTGEVWMQPGVTPGNLRATMGTAYLPGASRSGSVALVLGAGNIASIPPMDTLTKMFIDNEVVVLKMNPVNAYLGHFLAEAFGDLVEAGYLDIVYGGAAEGKHLTNHELIDSIHITGSDKTHDTIVFGSGPEGQKRKATNEPILQKQITSELGNVSPIIVVPGPWTTADIEYQGRNIAGMLTHNAGFNCIAARVIVTHAEWQHREALLASIEQALEETTQRAPYYPGARQRFELFTQEHPEASIIGDASGDAVPWTLIAGVDSSVDDICFSTESFAAIFAEAPLEAPRSVPDYVELAVEFVNNKLWGTLGATMIVHPSSLKDPDIATAVEEAISNLQYGTVGLNVWIGLGYALGSTTWGAYPGHPLNDIQSGRGVVHNSYMFDSAQKSVLRAPFKQQPKPLWFGTNKQAHNVTRHLVELEANPSPLRLAPVLGAALRG